MISNPVLFPFHKEENRMTGSLNISTSQFVVKPDQSVSRILKYVITNWTVVQAPEGSGFVHELDALHLNIFDFIFPDRSLFPFYEMTEQG